MVTARRRMVEVDLVDDESGRLTGDALPGASTAPSLEPPNPPRGRGRAWMRAAQRWWPVAAGLALVLLVASVLADQRERDRMAALADVPGVLAPLGYTVTERWTTGDGQYRVLGATSELWIGLLDRADGSEAVLGLDATTGDPRWEIAIRAAGAVPDATSCTAPTEATTDLADVVVCVAVVDLETVTASATEAAAGDPSLPRTSHLLVLDATDGTVLADETADPSTTVSSAGQALVIGQVRSDGRYQVDRKNAWGSPAGWTFTTPEPLGVDEFGNRTAEVLATGDLVQVESWSMSIDGGARSSWVLAADGTALRSPALNDSAGYGAGFAVLRQGRLLAESGIASGSDSSQLTDLATGSSIRVDASPFDPSPDDGSLDDLVFARSPTGDGLIAYDLAAGRQLWTVPSTGTTEAMVIEGRLIRAETNRLVSVDGRTGETVWSTPITVQESGSTGQSTATADMGATIYSYQSASTSVFTDGSVVLAATTDTTGAVQLTAFGLDDGRELWTSTLPRGMRLDQVDGELYGHSEHGLVALG